MNPTYEIIDFEPTILCLTVRRPDNVLMHIMPTRTTTCFSIVHSNHTDKQPLVLLARDFQRFLDKQPHIRDFVDANMR